MNQEGEKFRDELDQHDWTWTAPYMEEEHLRVAQVIFEKHTSEMRARIEELKKEKATLYDEATDWHSEASDMAYENRMDRSNWRRDAEALGVARERIKELEAEKQAIDGMCGTCHATMASLSEQVGRLRKALEEVSKATLELQAHMEHCRCSGGALDYERHCSKLAGYKEMGELFREALSPAEQEPKE